MQNLYVLNHNGCKNKCFEIGVEAGFDWILPFSNSTFFTKHEFKELHRSLVYYCDHDVFYNTVSTVRLDDSNTPNGTLITQDYSVSPNEHVPQICFRRDAPLTYNKIIPLGSGAEEELLNSLRIPGPWSEEEVYRQLHSVSCRSCEHVKLGKNGVVYRLNTFCKENTSQNRDTLQVYGTLNLLSRINVS